MDCPGFRTASVSDDEGERLAAERHAAVCPRCADLLQDDRDLARQVARWKAASSGPPPDLLRRITEAAGRESGTPPLPRIRPGLAHRPRFWLAAAAAAVLLAAAGWVLRGALPRGTAGDSLEQVMRDAEEHRAEYVRAIAEMERRARTVLARAADPGLRPDQAALLLSYRDRLTHLDAVIAEVQKFLNEHPGHAGGHAVLLAAYDEKFAVLGALLELPLGETS